MSGKKSIDRHLRCGNVGHERHIPNLPDLWPYVSLSNVRLDPFVFINGTAEAVRFTIDPTNKQTLVQIDMDGNNVADMEIELTGIKILSANDFLLSIPT